MSPPKNTGARFTNPGPLAAAPQVRGMMRQATTKILIPPAIPRIFRRHKKDKATEQSRQAMPDLFPSSREMGPAGFEPATNRL